MKHLFLAFAALMLGLDVQAEHGCQHKEQLDKMHRAHPEWIQGQKARRIALEHFTHQHMHSQAACTTDVKLDGFVAIDDFLLLLGEFGNTCE